MGMMVPMVPMLAMLEKKAMRPGAWVLGPESLRPEARRARGVCGAVALWCCGVCGVCGGCGICGGCGGCGACPSNAGAVQCGCSNQLQLARDGTDGYECGAVRMRVRVRARSHSRITQPAVKRLKRDGIHTCGHLPYYTLGR